MRTMVVTDIDNTDTLNSLPSARRNRETFLYWPNDNPRRSFYEGDTRAALAPFLVPTSGATYVTWAPPNPPPQAYQALQQQGVALDFDWMLYGDDDTVFFQRGTIALASTLNASMPYFLTDHLWFVYPGYGAHPSDTAPRCLPCNWQGPTVYRDGDTPVYQAPIGCPCTPSLLCSPHVFATQPWWRGTCDRAPVYAVPQQLYSMHGGAGALLSRGLLQAVNMSTITACVKATFATGGDSFITECLWQHGFAITDPGFSFQHPGVRVFDPADARTTPLLMALLDKKNGGTRCPACSQHVDNLVSAHVGSRGFESFEDAAMYVEQLVELTADV